MSNVRSLKSQGQLSEEASLWLARLERELAGNEEAGLKAWMMQDERNQAELLTLAELWDEMDSLTQLSRIIPTPNTEYIRPWKAVAASILVAIGIAGLILNDRWKVEQPVDLLPEDVTHYETEVGDRSTVMLSDGSRVQLNTNTRLSVRMQPEQRILRLERGESHFDVAHDADRPFLILAHDRVIEAVGTAFSVRIVNGGDVEVLVTEGQVEVDFLQDNADRDSDFSHDGRLLSENERLSPHTGEIELLAPTEIVRKLSWRQGNLIFSGETLDSAVAEIERYMDVTFVIQEVELKQLRVAGLYRAGDLEGFLSSLRNNLDIDSEQIDINTIELSRRLGIQDH